MEFTVFSICALPLAQSLGAERRAWLSAPAVAYQGRAEQSGRVTSLALLAILLMQPRTPVCFRAMSDHDQLGACLGPQVPVCRAALQPESCLWRQTVEAGKY